MRLTKEQYESLKPYAKHIISAYKNSFLHMSGTDFLKVAELYKDIFNETITKARMSCNTCRLNALRKLGELYVAYEAKEKERAQKETADNQEPKEEKPKRTRTKKLEAKEIE